MRIAGSSLLLLILSFGTSNGAPRPKDMRKPVDPPSGDWIVQRIEGDAEREANKGSDWVVSFGPKSWKVLVGRVPLTDERAAYYQNGEVFEIDFGSQDSKRACKGIWKTDGDRLLLSYGEPGADRPNDFVIPKDSKRTLWTLKRKKD